MEDLSGLSAPECNHCTKRFPLPNIEETLQGLQGYKYFTVIDLLKGYFQLPLDPESQKHTAFVTARGCYCWTVVPMGAKNAGAYFQMQISTVVLKDLISNNICRVYMDDIIIYAMTREELWVNARQVIEQFSQYNIVIKSKECKWEKREVQYLGIVVNEEGLKMSDSRIEAVAKIYIYVRFN